MINCSETLIFGQSYVGQFCNCTGKGWAIFTSQVEVPVMFVAGHPNCVLICNVIHTKIAVLYYGGCSLLIGGVPCHVPNRLKLSQTVQSICPKLSQTVQKYTSQNVPYRHIVSVPNRPKLSQTVQSFCPKPSRPSINFRALRRFGTWPSSPPPLIY